METEKLIFLRFHMADGIVSKLMPIDLPEKPTAPIVRPYVDHSLSHTIGKTRRYRYFSTDIEPNALIFNFMEDI